VFAVASPLGLKSIPEGAATQCYLAVNPGAAGVSGEYFSHCNVAKCRADANDPALAKRLWQRTEEIVAALATAGGRREPPSDARGARHTFAPDATDEA